MHLFHFLLGVTLASALTAENGTLRQSCTCGIRGRPERIVGGVMARERDYLWMVVITQGFSFCGGSIIAPGWVVTAAHCMVDTLPASLTVIAGSNFRFVSTSMGQMRKVTRIISHPSYDERTSHHDIALLQLATPLTFTTAVSSICLPQLSLATSTFEKWNATATGWGATSHGGESPDSLLEVTLPVISLRECKTYMNPLGILITENMLCTYEPRKDACQGDSGGPLFVFHSKRAYLIGITSFGVGCGGFRQPGVFTKVNNYIDWIKKTSALTFCSP